MLTVIEVSKKLFVVPGTVRSYIRNGLGNPKERLKAIQVRHGRRKEYRIKQDDLEYFRKKYLV